MRLLPLALIAAVGLFGCDNGGFGNGDGENPNGVDGTQDLEDPNQDIVYEEVCDGIEDSTGTFQEVAGATRYYIGEFTISEDDEVTGRETLKILANDKWAEVNPTDGKDCDIVWLVQSGSVDRDAGPASGYRMTFTASISETMTTCSQAVAEGYYTESDGPSFTVSYDVGIDCSTEPCTSYVNFVSGDGSTGSELGEGTADDDGLTYTSDASCQFY